MSKKKKSKHGRNGEQALREEFRKSRHTLISRVKRLEAIAKQQAKINRLTSRLLEQS